MLKVTVGNNISRKTVLVENDTTLRTVLEDNEIDYTRGMTSLDGATLVAGDLDKTFADFNVGDKCYLLNVVKADNAVTAVVSGEACVLKSSLKLEDIALAKKYRPKDLVVVDTDSEEELFKVSIAKNGPGSASTYGIEFAPTPDREGYAQVTIMMPAGHGKAEEWVEDNFGAAITYLKMIEADFESVLAEISADRQIVKDAIRVI